MQQYQLKQSPTLNLLTIALPYIQRQVTTRGDPVRSLVGAFLATPLVSPMWPFLLFGWQCITDCFGWAAGENLAPPGRLLQILIEEAGKGDLTAALTTTGVRNATALLLAVIVALPLVHVMGEFKRPLRFLLPWLRCLALVPPAILFIYAPYFEAWLRDHVFHQSLSFTNATSLELVFLQPARLLLLASIGLWPLLIIGLERYSTVSEHLADEIRGLRLPRLRAAVQVKLPTALQSLNPGIQIAVVLIFVVCLGIEECGATQTSADGVSYYISAGFDRQARDVLLFSVATLVGGGLFFLLVSDAMVDFFCGSRTATD